MPYAVLIIWVGASESVSSEVALPREFSETEIEHLNDAVAAQHDVVGFDVAMNDADGVRGGKCARDLDSDVDNVGAGERSASDPVAQRFAVDELRDDEMLCVDLVDLVDRENVWMVQGGRGFGFLYETSNAVAGGAGLIFDDFNRENFECYFAVESGVVSQIDLTHTARA